MNLGVKIRALRKERGFSLAQLAAKSGVALGTLSRLENGKLTGTFKTHRKLAEAFDLPLPDLYRHLEEPDSDAIVLLEPATADAETFTYDAKAQAVLLARQVARKRMLPQLVIVEAGGRTALEQYPRGTERWLYGLEGAVEAAVGTQRYRITAGGTLYFKASLPHQFVNAARTVAKVLSVTSPVVL